MITAASLADAALQVQQITGQATQEFNQSAGSPLPERLAALTRDVDYYRRSTEEKHYHALRVLRYVKAG